MRNFRWNEWVDFFRQYILPMFLCVLFVLFFVGGPKYHSPRFFKTFWNLGHILFFSLLPYYVFACMKWLSDRFGRQCLITMGVAVGLGILIELVQHNFHRTPDLGDVFRDAIGGLVGIFFLLPGRRYFQRKLLLGFQVVTIGLVCLQVYPVIVALSDELIAWDQFPVLSDFETPWEIQRWTGGADFNIDDRVHLGGKHALRVGLKKDRYSGVTLFYFPHDWERAKSFQFSVYNPADEVLYLTCRIHDAGNEKRKGRYRYEDRFDRRFAFEKGWRTVEIPISEIENAPKGRKMDLRHILEVAIFATRLPEPRVVYIDDVRLGE